MMVQCSLFCVFFYQLLEKKTTTTIKQTITKGAALQTSEKNKQNKINGP